MTSHLRLVPDPVDPPAPGSALPRPRDAVEPLGDGTAPGPHECLPCYVGRLLEREGCDHSLRWALRWRDARAPRAKKLDRRLEDRGGFCDCEVLFNVFPGHEFGDGCAGRVGGEAMTPCREPRFRRW